MRGELPENQSFRNVREARRVMALLPDVDFSAVASALDVGNFDLALKRLAKIDGGLSVLTPNPIVVIRAEIVNAMRYANDR